MSSNGIPRFANARLSFLSRLSVCVLSFPLFCRASVTLFPSRFFRSVRAQQWNGSFCSRVFWARAPFFFRRPLALCHHDGPRLPPPDKPFSLRGGAPFLFLGQRTSLFSPPRAVTLFFFLPAKVPLFPCSREADFPRKLPFWRRCVSFQTPSFDRGTAFFQRDRGVFPSKTKCVLRGTVLLARRMPFLSISRAQSANAFLRITAILPLPLFSVGVNARDLFSPDRAIFSGFTRVEGKSRRHPSLPNC